MVPEIESESSVHGTRTFALYHKGLRVYLRVREEKLAACIRAEPTGKGYAPARGAGKKRERERDVGSLLTAPILCATSLPWAIIERQAPAPAICVSDRMNEAAAAPCRTMMRRRFVVGYATRNTDDRGISMRGEAAEKGTLI